MGSPSSHLAQVNIATPKAPVDSPLLAEFKALLDPVNATADAAPGFVWRLQDEDGNATAIPVFDDDSLIVNPDVREAESRLSKLRERGPTEHAFTFKQRLPAPATAKTPLT